MMNELKHGLDWTFVNAIDIETTGSGLIPLRFSRPHLEKMGSMAIIARMATGIEIQLRGTIQKVEIDFKTIFSDDYGEGIEWYWGPYKILPHGKLGGTNTTTTLVLNVATWPKVDSRYPLRLIFPTHCEVEVQAVRIEGEAMPASTYPTFDYRQLPGALGLRWLAHGDSLTQGANCSVPTMNWVDITARTLGLKATNLGIGGYGKAEAIIAEAIAARNDFDVLSLHVGANAKDAALFRSDLKEMISIIRVKHPATPIFVASPILSMSVEGTMEPTIGKMRATSEALLESLVKTDPNLYLLRGDELHGDPNGMNVDYLHLCDFGFSRYAANAIRLMRPVLKQTAKEILL
jgi:hypothetical protein